MNLRSTPTRSLSSAPTPNNMESLLFVGLGNPGKQYEHTRHNLGIRLLRAWAPKDWRYAKKFNAEVAAVTTNNTLITCLFPLTSMNRSGEAVARFTRRRISRLWRGAYPTSYILIIHDDLELPLGSFRIKPSGSAHGHKGVRSIHESLNTQDIPRLLLGIGPATGPPQEFVLGRFSSAEEVKIAQMIPPACSALTNFANKKSPPHNPTDE